MARFGLQSKEHVERALRAAEATTVWIGIQSTQGRQPKEGDDGGDVPNLATVAAVHEFGAVTTSPDGQQIRVPQRSYMRATADVQGKAWLRVLGAAIKAYANEDVAGYDRRIKAIGVVSTGQIRALIRARIAPPLSAITIARRRKGRGDGEDVPLIDTQQLISSIRAQAATVAGPVLIG